MDDRITVSVDADVADAYRAASDGDRRKLDLLINLRLREAGYMKLTGKSAEELFPALRDRYRND